MLNIDIVNVFQKSLKNSIDTGRRKYSGYRSFAKSNVKISRLGFGGWGIGAGMWVGAEDKESKRVLHKAVESGINFFDSHLFMVMEK